MANGRLAAWRAVARKGYWRDADARLVLGAWRTSGQTICSFAAAHGLRAPRLVRWAARLGVSQSLPRKGSEQQSTSAVKLRFHPVEVVGGGGVRWDVIELVLVDGRRVRVPAGFAAEDLARLLGVLQGVVDGPAAC